MQKYCGYTFVVVITIIIIIIMISDKYLVKTNRFYIYLLGPIKRLKSIIEIILFYSRSTTRCRPYFYRIYRHGKIADSIT